MKLHRVSFVISSAVFLVGCASGQVIEGSNSGPIDQSFDGAYMAYYLPRGELVAKAAYDPTTETITITPDTRILPDLQRTEKVLYRHSDMSNDVVTIELESNGLLKSVATTTTDQSKEVVKAVAEVAQQFGTLRTAILKPAYIDTVDIFGTTDKTPPPAKDPPPPTCSKMSVTATFDLTYGASRKSHVPRNSIETKASPGTGDQRNPMPVETCELSVSISDASDLGKGAIASSSPLPAAAYPATAFQYEEKPKICPINAVCFRTAIGRELKITAHLTRPRFKTQPAETTQTIVAPGQNQGVLYFNRRAFVSNSTSATFSNGMLTKLTATDPSAALGALQLSTEILKSFTVLVRL